MVNGCGLIIDALVITRNMRHDIQGAGIYNVSGTRKTRIEFR
jgi:hypothetical protein